MHIGIIGTGNMGSALGQRLSDAGHQIFYGSIEPGTAKSIADMMAPNVQGGSIANAADFGEVIFLAVPWSGVDNAIEEAGDLEGRIIFDCTNPFKEDTLDLIYTEHSGAEYIAHKVGNAQVVKALNTIFAQNIMKASDYGDSHPSAFFCTDDESAQNMAAELLEDMKLAPVYCGPLENASHLESMGALLFKLGDMPGNNLSLTFQLINRPE